MDVWYVLEIKRHREKFASLNLSRAGLVSYLPLIREWPRPAVGGDIRPLFPGYLFANLSLSKDFRMVSRTPGVKRFVTIGGDPARLPESVIAYLRNSEDHGVIPFGQHLHQGESVMIVAGPLRGLTAMFHRRLSSAKRAQVLISLFQRETIFELPDSWVRRG